MDNNLFRPSNGSEGAQFVSEFCMKCKHCNPDPNGKKQCEILAKTMAFDTTD